MLSKDQIKTSFAKARKAQQAGRFQDAVAGYTQLIKQVPNLAEAHFNLAEVFSTRAQFADAARHFEAALKLRPGEPAIWLSYLQLAERHPNVDNLAKLLARAQPVIGAKPASSYFGGFIAARKGDNAKAAMLFKAAIAAGFTHPRVHLEYGSALAKHGQNEEALRQYQQAIAAQPSNPLALSRKSELLRDMGRFDEALEAGRAAIKHKPDEAALYHTYSSIQKMRPNDPLIAPMEKLAKSSKLNDASKVHIGHALAKTMEDTAQTDKVFGYLRLANDANARAHPFDVEDDKRSVAQLQDSFLNTTSQSVTDTTDAAPIFVTGLPRSGTTLVEQILSAAPDVAGGGELGLLGAMILPVLSDPDKLASAGHAYAAELVRRFPEAGQVTDKSISTYAHIGFVKRAIPNAKIVVVRRDPADNALSIYKNMFAPGSHRYAATLKGIAQFMRLFEAQLAFWRKHCPDDFYEIAYEDLITDREGQARALVAAAGLSWHDRFLESHKNTRKVTTLSSAQVRRPIYLSSVQAWKRYEVDMQPFLTEYAKLDPAK